MTINSVVTSFRGRRIAVLAAMAAACLLFAAYIPPAAAADGTDRYTMYVPGQRSNVAGLDSQTNLNSPDCGTDQPLAKIVNTLSRTGGSGTAYLRCGQQATFGLRHINYGHGQDWENIRVRYAQPGDWASFMKNTTSANLNIPASNVRYNVNNTNKDVYTGLLCIRDNTTRNVVRAYDVIIPVASDSRNIITSYPTGARASDARC